MVRVQGEVYVGHPPDRPGVDGGAHGGAVPRGVAHAERLAEHAELMHQRAPSLPGGLLVEVALHLEHAPRVEPEHRAGGVGARARLGEELIGMRGQGSGRRPVLTVDPPRLELPQDGDDQKDQPDDPQEGREEQDGPHAGERAARRLGEDQRQGTERSGDHQEDDADGHGFAMELPAGPAAHGGCFAHVIQTTGQLS